MLTTTTPPPVTQQVHRAAGLLRGRRVLALSGAGLSTESGIPDYRGPQSSKKPRTPMRYQTFVASREARRRYWARSLVGWPAVARAAPNRGHEAVAGLEAGGVISGVITQNVDGLHGAAGSRNVVELHGALSRVQCLKCCATEPRERLQRRMLHLNPDFEAFQVTIAPDGDADVLESLIERFVVPACLRCGGVLKPDVVFFGENVPKARVEAAWDMLEAAEVLLVVGSSLTVFSGYRFVARAAREGKPVLIINQGPTRGDKDASLRVDAKLGEALPELARQLLGTQKGCRLDNLHPF